MSDSQKKDIFYSYKLSEDEWRRQLTKEEYAILRQKGTDIPYAGKHYMIFDDGTFSCKGCQNLLFKSDTKFHSNCGWPSFNQCIDTAIEYVNDSSLSERHRIEILCSNCGSHIGHLFDDPNSETEIRYCVNSTSLNFK